MAAVAQLAQSHISAFGRDTYPSMDQPIAPVDYLPNPQFVFPLQSPDSPTTTPAKRPVSLSINPTPSPRQHAHQRKSVSTLPTFTFNATDTTGLTSGSASSTSAGQISPTTPSRAMRHRRGASEYVGGNGRFGAPDLVSTSPAKNNEANSMLALNTLSPSGSPAKRRGHAHRRSGAVSAHEIPTISPSRDATMAKANMAMPSSSQALINDAIFGAPDVLTEQESAQVRPRVGFSDSVTIIPRPLSTISSETDSTMSTPTGHSMTNSISSMSFGTASPSPARHGRSSLSQSITPADESIPSMRSSPELSKSLDKEGHWLKGDDERPLSDSAAMPRISLEDGSSIPQLTYRKIQFSGLDRRRSEPSISLGVPQQAKVSSLSLQEPAESRSGEVATKRTSSMERKSSVKRVKAWASSVMNRKEKPSKRAKSMDLPSLPAMKSDVGSGDASAFATTPEVEADLDEFFSQDPFNEPGQIAEQSIMSPRFEFSPTISHGSSSRAFQDLDDSTPVLDLDMALEPLENFSSSLDGRSSSFGGRRQLHSARMQRDFMGAPLGGYHQRALSAPALAPFEYSGRSSSPSQSPMADVFEEEEEEDEVYVTPFQEQKDFELHRTEQEEGRAGSQAVDDATDHGRSPKSKNVDDGLGIQRGLVAPAKTLSTPVTSTHLSTPPMSRRPSAMIEESVTQESSPIEIVEDYEEPRASSTTKSSDSSETPTLLADSSGIIISLPSTQPSPMTPTTYAASTFSSPDLARRQGSFDTSRLGTSASSITDNRTMSSFATGEPGPELRMSQDDVPSLTSSRSTMISTMQQRKDFSDRSSSIVSSGRQASIPDVATERRRKRSSIQSLSKLVGAPFGDSKSRQHAEAKSQTSTEPSPPREIKQKKEHRLSRLMFWKHKQPVRTPSTSQ